jgi:hypothetical protein
MLKKLLIAGAALTVIGGVGAGIAYGSGAKTTVAWDNGFKLIDRPKQAPSAQTSQLPTTDKFDTVVIDAANWNVRVTVGETFSMTQQAHNETLEADVRDGQLVISASRGSDGQVIFGDWDDDQAQAEITLPKSLKTLVIKGQNGEVDVADVTVQSLQIAHQNDDVTLRNVTADKATLNNANGDLTVISGRFKTLDLRNQNGDIDVQNASVTTGRWENVNGDIDIDGPLQNWHAKTTNGDLDINDQDVDDDRQNHQYSEGDGQQIIIDNQNGDIQYDQMSDWDD